MNWNGQNIYFKLKAKILDRGFGRDVEMVWPGGKVPRCTNSITFVQHLPEKKNNNKTKRKVSKTRDLKNNKILPDQGREGTRKLVVNGLATFVKC